MSRKMSLSLKHTRTGQVIISQVIIKERREEVDDAHD